MGRPTTYTTELGKYIADKIASSPDSLKKLCKDDPKFPDYPSTVYHWLNKFKDFNELYLEARKQQMHVAVESLNDQIEEDVLYYYDDSGNKRIDSPSATIAIAKANNKKWVASKFTPRYYGAKAEESDDSSQNSVLEKILNGEIEVKKK